jgi:hypothetical protein
MIRNFFPVLLLLPLSVVMMSCAGSGGGTNPDGTPKDDQSVNTLPWNKPASWEGSSPIPGSGGH